MNAPPSAIEQLQLALPDLDWITDAPRVGRLSQDFNWYSPVLKRQLADKRADVAVKPRTEAEIVRLLAACAKHRVPVTPRGSGTGNYGQAVPLRGGVLLDMSGYNGLVWHRGGVARAQAGMRLGDLEKETRRSGWELRCFPSTWKIATVGGLYGGGFGGVGSINYGPLAARGNVLGIRAVTLEETPQLVELRGDEALAMHHLWGTNGLVLEIELALAPVHDWLEAIATFESFDRGLEFCNALAMSTGIVKREIGFYASPVPDYLTQLKDHLPAGCHAALVTVAAPSEEALRELAALHGGTITYRKTAEEAAHRTLLEFAWNHTTFHAMKVDKSLTYLQSSFTAGRHLEQVRQMEKLLGGEVMLHAEWIRGWDGQTTCTALQIVRFSTEERLAEIMAIFRANGVRINDPHVFIVEDGKAQGALPTKSIELKKRFDPHGLLNPGKMRTWEEAKA